MQPSTAYPAVLLRDSRCRDTIGIRLPTAAEVPKTIENASVIPIISTARPKRPALLPSPHRIHDFENLFGVAER